jgi:hypothetical protein
VSADVAGLYVTSTRSGTVQETTSRNRGLLAVIVAALVLAIAPAAAEPTLEYETWFVGNEGLPCWGAPDGYPSYAEWMHPASYFVFGDLAICALDPENPYVAISPLYDRIMRGCHFWAEIWLANHVDPTVPQRVDAELWMGTGAPAYRWASATVMVANGAPGVKYDFDFGYFEEFPLILTHIWLKVVYYGSPGVTHVYWNHLDSPTALRVEGTVVGVEAKTWGSIKSLYRE